MLNSLVSVVIPTYKGDETLSIALQSVIAQSYKNIEVIVSDDNGKGTNEQKKTQAVINKFSDILDIKYIINKHVNGSYARNRGIEQAKGAYICLLDDDDLYFEKYIEKIVSSFENNDDVDFCFCNVAFLAREGFFREVKNSNISSKELVFLDKEIGTGSNICFRRRVFEEDGGFDERYLRYQDLEFVSKKLSKYSSIWINELLILKYFSVHENYLNVDKNLNMQKILQEDLLINNIISQDEYLALACKQHHVIFTDMMIKNMPVDDVKRVYYLMVNEKGVSIKDRLIFCIYRISKKLFNLSFKLFSVLSQNNSNTVQYQECKKYRDKIIASIK